MKKDNDYKDLIEFLKKESNDTEDDMQFFLCMDILENMKQTALYLKKNEDILPPIEFYTKLKQIFTGFEITHPIIEQQIKNAKKLFS